MSSKIEIINMALAKLSNGNFIQSLDENNPEAQQAQVHWETMLDTVLTEFPWDFSRRLAQLVQVADDTGLSEWAYHYLYPADCVYIRRVFPLATPAYSAPYRRGLAADGLQRVVMTNQAQACAEYTTRAVAPENLPPQFVNALAWRLAAEIASSFKGEPQMAQHCLQYYTLQLDEAKVRDARESGPQSRIDGNWIRSRDALSRETVYQNAQQGNG